MQLLFEILFIVGNHGKILKGKIFSKGKSKLSRLGNKPGPAPRGAFRGRAFPMTACAPPKRTVPQRS